MSASREKKQRQNDPSQGLTQKQRQEQAEQQAARRRGILYAVIGVIAAVLVVVLLVWHSGVFQRSATAVSVAGRDYNATDVAYYYYAAMNDEYQRTYGSTFNPQEDLHTQYVDEAQTQSYHDRFLNLAMDSMTTVAALENAAAADGYTLSAEERQAVEEIIENTKAAARQYGYDYAGFLKANYGQYMTPGAYKACLEREALVNGYSTSIREKETVTDDELQNYYKENAASVDSYDFRVVYISGTAPSGTDSEGNAVTPTEEENAAALQSAKTSAERFVSQVEAAADREAKFIELAPRYVSEESRSNYEEDPDYSLAEGVSGGNLSSYSLPYVSWLTEAGRKSGDVTAATSGSGYYVVLFLDRYLDESATANIRHILVKAELNQQDDPATADVDESRIPSQEALDAAKAQVESLLAQWESGPRTAESFGELAKEHSADSGSAANNGLIEHVYQGQMFEAFNDWCMDPARQSGETAVLENPQSGQQGWHAIYFESWEPPLWKVNAEITLKNDRMTDWLDGLTEGLEAVQGSGAQYVG